MGSVLINSHSLTWIMKFSVFYGNRRVIAVFIISSKQIGS
jgi:hypothetical protein